MNQNTAAGSISLITFFIDVDNTLIDNDALKAELNSRMQHLLGEGGAEFFWQVYEDVRQEKGYIDLYETSRRYADVSDAFSPVKPEEIQNVFENLPFHKYVYPQSFKVLTHLKTLGVPAILSDGDNAYQPLKIEKSGLKEAVGNRVLVYTHKDEHIQEITRLFPAQKYVFIDDKLDLLHIIKQELPAQSRIVWVEQGHYAQAIGKDAIEQEKPDTAIKSIEDLLHFTSGDF